MTPQYQQNPYQQPSFDPSGGTSGPGPLGLDPKMAAMLCYLPVCLIGLVMSIIGLVSNPPNGFVKFHAKQSLFLHAIFIVVGVVVGVVIGILAQISPTIGGILSLLVNLVFLVLVLGINVFLMIKAFGGNKMKLPVIGDLADK